METTLHRQTTAAPPLFLTYFLLLLQLVTSHEGRTYVVVIDTKLILLENVNCPLRYPSAYLTSFAYSTSNQAAERARRTDRCALWKRPLRSKHRSRYTLLFLALVVL